MAGSSLLTLIDDIASLLDDVATMSKVALEKTAGVVGDDLALNAKQIVGVKVDRELPVVWAVSRGSLLNKVILVPIALAISALAPWAITPLLMLGGAYLCFEGCEKLLHAWLHPPADDHKAQHPHPVAAPSDPKIDLAALERDKIRGAIRTDFVLSAEIIVIALGTVAGEPMRRQFMVLSAVALLMTVGVYGLVAAIIKLDDAGLFLSRRPGTQLFGRLERRLGRFVLAAAPWLMRGLSVAGTIAMFMVGGGILTHGIPVVHHGIEHLAEATQTVPVVGSALALTAAGLSQAVFGVVAGSLILGLVSGIRRLRQTPHHSAGTTSAPVATLATAHADAPRPAGQDTAANDKPAPGTIPSGTDSTGTDESRN